MAAIDATPRERRPSGAIRDAEKIRDPGEERGVIGADDDPGLREAYVLSLAD